VPFRLSQSIPLMVNGVLYLGWPYNHVAAIGRDRQDPVGFPGTRKFARHSGPCEAWLTGRVNKQTLPQILFGTEDGELYSVNARTGELTPVSVMTESST